MTEKDAPITQIRGQVSDNDGPIPEMHVGKLTLSKEKHLDSRAYPATSPIDQKIDMP